MLAQSDTCDFQFSLTIYTNLFFTSTDFQTKPSTSKAGQSQNWKRKKKSRKPKESSEKIIRLDQEIELKMDDNDTHIRNEDSSMDGTEKIEDEGM